MPRAKRIIYPGALYHVISRGNDKKTIFRQDFDRKKFLKYLEWQHISHQVRVFGYCLMDNHYHLIIETPLPNLPKIMQELQGGYATYFNVKYKCVGHLFQGRYKAKVVERELYLKQLSRYVHRNPLKAGRSDMMQNGMWSSYLYFARNIPPPTWLFRDEIMSLFNHNRNAYINYVETVSAEDNKFHQIVNRNRHICSKQFLKGV